MDFRIAMFASQLVAALIVVLITTPLAKKIAWKVGAIDYPSKRRINTEPIPRMGGIAVALGLLAAVLVEIIGSSLLGWPSVIRLTRNENVNYLGLLLSFIIMFGTGLVDDARQLHPLTKFVWQVIAACVAVASGLEVGNIVSPTHDALVSLGWVAAPITVFYLVAFANIMNLIDGIDGLASGITVIAGATMFILALMSNNLDAAALSISLVGACLGFLRYNFNPASIFLGDSGSLLLGYSLGVTSLLNVTRIAGLTTLAIPIVIAGVPILDTFAAIIRRVRAKVSIGSADKGHIHHRLLREGLNQRQTVFFMYGWTAILCVGAVCMTKVNAIVRIAIFAILVVATFGVARLLKLFDPVSRKRLDPETGHNEVVPIDEVPEEEDYTPEEIDDIVLGRVGPEEGVVDTGQCEHPLNILAVGQHYWPEPFNFSDILEGLVARGHHVTMLTGLPNYPEGDIYSGYEHGEQRDQVHNGVHIVRSSLIPRKNDPIHRVLNYYSFSSRASRKALTLQGNYDVVLSFQTSPVMMSNPAIAYARQHHVPLLLYCIDIWPECLIVGGIKKNSLIFKHYRRVSRKIYSSADELAVTSPMFRDYFENELGMQGVQALYLPQYAEDIFGEPAEYRHDLYDPDKINLTFAGNVGGAQSVNTIIEAAHYLSDDDRFVFHIVGSGSELNTLKAYAKELGVTNVLFHGRFPLADMPSFYLSSDAMLATFSNSPILAYTLPRKIQSYMAAGRPVLGTLVGEARRVVEEAQCGLCCDAGDGEGLAQICREFANLSKSQREDMGIRGREYYKLHYSRKRFFESLESALEDLEENQQCQTMTSQPLQTRP